MNARQSVCDSNENVRRASRSCSDQQCSAVVPQDRAGAYTGASNMPTSASNSDSGASLHCHQRTAPVPTVPTNGRPSHAHAVRCVAQLPPWRMRDGVCRRAALRVQCRFGANSTTHARTHYTGPNAPEARLCPRQTCRSRCLAPRALQRDQTAHKHTNRSDPCRFWFEYDPSQVRTLQPMHTRNRMRARSHARTQSLLPARTVATVWMGSPREQTQTQLYFRPTGPVPTGTGGYSRHSHHGGREGLCRSLP